MINCTAKFTGIPGEYAVYDADGEFVANIGPTGVGGDEFFRVYWYGCGSLHGKIDITEGGIEGALEYIAEKIKSNA